MRFTVFIFLIFMASSGCHQGNSSTGSFQPNQGINQDSSKLTSIEWKEQTRDFGKIAEGQKLVVEYAFKNTGTQPLIITKVEPGCGCTVAETPKEPISPGQEGTIKASFDSNGRLGSQHKTIMVYANTKGSQSHELVFTVNVKKAD